MPDPVQLKKTRLPALVICLLFVFGLYFPTAVAESLSLLLLLAYLIYAVLLFLLIFRKRGRLGTPACMVLLSITPLLLLFTFTSGLATYRFGALIVYGLLSLLLVVNVRDIVLPHWFGRVWIAANIINIVIGFAIVAGIQPVDDFIIAGYSTAYDELVSSMLAAHKPVLTFGSHSTAAFFLYLFFWINLQGHKLTGRKWAFNLVQLDGADCPANWK